MVKPFTQAQCDLIRLGRFFVAIVYSVILIMVTVLTWYAAQTWEDFGAVVILVVATGWFIDMAARRYRRIT
jgi:hypothetical protein